MILKWLNENKKWLFSGLLVAVCKGIYDVVKEEGFHPTWGNLLYLATAILITITIIEILSVLRRKDFFNYGKSKIREFFHLLLEDRQIIIKGTSRYHCFDLHSEYKRTIKTLNDFICYNQGWLAQYPFIVGELHKHIKEEFRKKNNGDGMNKILLQQHYQDLNERLTSHQENILAENYNKYMTSHFEGRSRVQPRICIKGIGRIEGDEIGVVDIFRPESEYITEYPIHSNKGFYEVYKTGKWYICNDIPTAAKKDEYFNPRLDNRKVRTIYLANMENNTPEQNLEKWIACWSENKREDNPEPEKPSERSCYKSTLIIPMTLINNEDLQDNFKRHFKIPRHPIGKEMARAIYGFLCFDHQEINFFNEEVDVPVGYVFADIMSLYLVYRLTYTEYSQTFKKVADILK